MFVGESRTFQAFYMIENTTEDNKSFGEAGGFAEISSEFKKFQSDMKNPLVVGALLSALREERSSTNLILKEINAKLDRLLQAIDKQESKVKELLPEVDGEIIAFVRKKEHVDAEGVQKHFKYKGKNAASARLNSLYRAGLVEKRQVGKKVYFMAK